MALVTKFSGGWACPAVASVGLVSLLFFPEKKLTTFFLVSHRRLQSDDPFSAVRPRLSTVLSKFSHIFFISFGCHPLEGVTQSGPLPLPPVTPLVPGPTTTAYLPKDKRSYMLHSFKVG